MKQCSKCKEIKNKSEFYKDKYSKDELTSLCKICNFNQSKKYNILNKEKLSKYNKEYQIRNKKKIARCKKIYREKNIEEVKKREQKSRNKRREKICIYNREYKLLNKEKIKEHYTLNKKRILKVQKNYIRNKRINVPEFRIIENIRRRILSAIKENTKSASSLELLGCSIKKARNHLKKQFKKGMTWENYGKYGWHMDHIRPCASFDLSDPEQQKVCFNYKNLQPLWAKDNLSKGAKIQ